MKERLTLREALNVINAMLMTHDGLCEWRGLSDPCAKCILHDRWVRQMGLDLIMKYYRLGGTNLDYRYLRGTRPPSFQDLRGEELP